MSEAMLANLEDLAQSQSATEAVGEAHMLGDLDLEAADLVELPCLRGSSPQPCGADQLGMRF